MGSSVRTSFSSPVDQLNKEWPESGVIELHNRLHHHSIASPVKLVQFLRVILVVLVSTRSNTLSQIEQLLQDVESGSSLFGDGRLGRRGHDLVEDSNNLLGAINAARVGLVDRRCHSVDQDLNLQFLRSQRNKAVSGGLGRC